MDGGNNEGERMIDGGQMHGEEGVKEGDRGRRK